MPRRTTIPPGVDRLLTTEQVADWLGCSTAKLEANRAKGIGLPFIQLSKRMIRYRESAVQAEIADGTHVPAE
jgi:hypothetical protein